jgi:urease subunit alpha
MGKMHRRDYAAMYGPTTADAVRLGDTSLLAEIEHDHAVKGDECLHGGGKTLRDGMGLAAGYDSAAGALDMLLSNAVLIDPVLGIVKGDLASRTAASSPSAKPATPRS